MSLTVAQLIKRLSKMPPRARVVFVAHDQNPDDGEFDGFISIVDEAPEALKERGAGVMLI